MNRLQLKLKLGSNPSFSKRSLIIELVADDPIKAKNTIFDVMSKVIGKENIEDFELITTHLSLITLHEGLEHLMDSYREVQMDYPIKNQMYADVNSTIHYILHMVNPVNFLVEGTLDGIPRCSSVDCMELVERKISKSYPYLNDVSIVYIPFSCDTTSRYSPRSHYRVNAWVDDIRFWYSKIGVELIVPWKGFEGIMTLKTIGPAGECKGMLPGKVYKNIYLVKW